MLLFGVVCHFQLIPMTEIKEVSQDFQKLNKTENCIVIHMKNESKVAITSPVSICDTRIYIDPPPIGSNASYIQLVFIHRYSMIEHITLGKMYK